MVSMDIFNITFYRAKFHCILKWGLYNMRDNFLQIQNIKCCNEKHKEKVKDFMKSTFFYLTSIFLLYYLTSNEKHAD